MSDPLGDPFLVNTTTDGAQQLSAVAGLSGGGFVVAWQDSSQTGGDTSSGAIRLQIYGDGGTATGTELLVNTTTTGAQGVPQIAAVGDGFVVIWQDDSHTGDDTSSSAIRAQRFDHAGNMLSGEFLVDTTTFGFQLAAQVTGLSDGGFVVTWQDGSGLNGDISPYAIRARVYDADGQATGPDFLANTTTAGSQVGAGVTALSDGGFVITWRDNSGSSLAIKGQVYDASGAKVGGELLLDNDHISDFSPAVVTALSGGGFVVTYDGGDGDGLDVTARLFNIDGTPQGDAFTVNTSTAGAQVNQVCAALPTGGFVIAWQDSATNRIMAREYDASGHAVGDDYAISTSGHLPAEPSISALDDGDFVISWNETTGVGAAQNTDVYSRIFHSEGVVVPTDGNDHLQGTAAADSIDGLDGNDVILGLGGNDSLMGSAGDDTLDGGAGADLLDGGDGTDIVSYASAASGVTVRISPGAQHTGGGGIDTLVSIENLQGSGFKDHLTGSAKANELDGGAGNDKLSGGGGDDVLNGGAGKDQLAGGAGSDHFVFADGQADNDKVGDLASEDVIDLHLIDADTGQAGDQAFALVGVFSHHAGEAVLSYEAAKDLTLLQLDTDGDAKADVTIRLSGDHADFDSFVL